MKLYRCIFVLRKKTLLWNVFERFRRSLDKRRRRRRRRRRQRQTSSMADVKSCDGMTHFYEIRSAAIIYLHYYMP